MSVPWSVSWFQVPRLQSLNDHVEAFVVQGAGHALLHEASVKDLAARLQTFVRDKHRRFLEASKHI